MLAEAKAHFANARRLLNASGRDYDVHGAFMRLGQAKWCLSRTTSNRATDKVSKAIDEEILQMKTFLGNDPFSALDVSVSASSKEIKRAFRSLAKKWHPDKNSKDGRRESAHDLFIILRQAYEDLNDESKRASIAARVSRMSRPRTAKKTRAKVNVVRRPPRKKNVRETASSATKRSQPTTIPRNIWREKKKQPTHPKATTRSASRRARKAPPGSESGAKSSTDTTRKTRKKDEEKATASSSSSRPLETRSTNSSDTSTSQKSSDKKSTESSKPRANEKRADERSVRDVLNEAATYTRNSGAQIHRAFDIRSFIDRHTNIASATNDSAPNEFVRTNHKHADVTKHEDDPKDAKDSKDGDLDTTSGSTATLPSEENNWLLTPSEIVALRAHFEAADMNDDGVLTPEEVVRLASALGEFVDISEARCIPGGENDAISFRSFVEWWQNDEDDVDDNDLLSSMGFVLPSVLKSQDPSSDKSLKTSNPRRQENVELPHIDGTSTVDSRRGGGLFWGSRPPIRSESEEISSKNSEGCFWGEPTRTKSGAFWGQAGL